MSANPKQEPKYQLLKCLQTFSFHIESVSRRMRKGTKEAFSVKQAKELLKIKLNDKPVVEKVGEPA